MNSITLPDEVAPGLFPTKNKFGLMTILFDPYTLDFIEYTKTMKKGAHVLEIGAAYGAVSNILLNNNTDLKVTVNDLDELHLSIFTNSVKNNLNYKLACGHISEDINFNANTFDAILAARVLQYLSPQQLIITLKKMYRWLKKNGRIYIICKTPYIKLLTPFVSTYETKKSEGVAWPGIVNNLEEYVSDDSIKHIVPNFIHVFDPDTLSSVCRKVGFSVLMCSFIDRNDFPDDIKTSGKEEVGIILTKSSKKE